MFLWISSNSCPLNSVLIRSHQAEIIIVKRLIQGRNNVTKQKNTRRERRWFQLLDDPHTFHCSDYFVIGGIRTCLGVSSDPMFLWISSNSCPLNSVLIRSHQTEIIIVKRLIQGRNNVTRVRVEPRSSTQGRRKDDGFTVSATLPVVVF